MNGVTTSIYIYACGVLGFSLTRIFKLKYSFYALCMLMVVVQNM